MDEIIGRTIVGLRQMTRKELQSEGWEDLLGDSPLAVIMLDDGTALYASRDSEGNGPGTIFGYKGTLGFFLVPVEES